jgi:hypothetical protein
MALKQKNKSLISRIISGAAQGGGNALLLSELLAPEAFSVGADGQDLGFLSEQGGGTRDLSGFMGALPGVDPGLEPESALEGLDPAILEIILEQFPDLARMLPNVSSSVRFQ